MLRLYIIDICKISGDTLTPVCHEVE